MLEAPFAHPAVSQIKCVQNEIQKNVKEANNASLSRALAPYLNGLSQAITELETCNGNQ